MVTTKDADGAAAQPVARPEVLILGAGYGGLHLAQRLAPALRGRAESGTAHDPPIVLVDRRPYHQLTTELPRLVSGQVADAALTLELDPLIDARVVRFVQADVTAVRAPERLVETSAGPLGYRFLAIALGSVSNDFGIAGVREHMRPFLSTADARGLRIAAARAVEDAARLELDRPDADPAALQRLMTVLIGGAGPTGVEVAGELAEFLAARWKAAWQVAGEPAAYRLPRPRVVLVEAGPSILPGWSEPTAAAATAALRELGVEVRVGTRITRAEPGRVHMTPDAVVEAATLVWAGGVQAPQLLKESGLPTGPGGRVQVDEFGRVPGQPDVYVVGDAALHFDARSGRPLPPTADLALRQAETAALAIQATLQGRDPARVLRPLARQAVSVGRARGAANLLGLPVRGKAAHTLKDLIEWEYRQSITRLRGYSLATVV